MAVAPERERKEDYNRWRKAHAERQKLTPPQRSMTVKRIQSIDWEDFSEEEHY